MFKCEQLKKRRSMSSRQLQIIDLVNKRGFCSVNDLAKVFQVSSMTIRRDLSQLDEEKTLMRTHGGVMVYEQNNDVNIDFVEPDFALRMQKNHDKKQSIAYLANQLIKPNTTIALDVGTTTSMLAKELLTQTGIKLFTNNLHAAMSLASADFSVYLSGGLMRASELSINGPLATQQIRSFRFDVAFIGISGISSAGLFDYSIEDSETKRLYIENAQKVVALCDSSKFHRISVVHIGELSTLSAIVTDRKPTGELLDALNRAEVEIISALD